ncbi:nitroreductase family protein [Enterococcus casseliflavus]|uniref:nitroreductase family protein n=1 Tax=Enterococcus casseliflavus TaxID=37734 RepID=UPI003D146479
MKDKIKSILPYSVIKQYQFFKLKKAYNYDLKKFINNYSSENIMISSKRQLESRLVFYSHSIEKGLSRKDFRYNFGYNVLKKLSNVMKVYIRKGYGTNDSAWLNTLSVLNCYQNKHVADKIPLEFFDDVFEEFIDEIKESLSDLGGTNFLNNKLNIDNKEKNFEQLALERSSLREYSSEDVCNERLHNAVRIAMKTPSVCNRQSFECHIISDRNLIKEVLKIQSGLGGYDTPPKLILVTSRISSFLSVSERNQQFIDGGLFAMSLLYAIEYENLAACPLNAMFDMKNEIKIKKLLNIDDSVSLIMFISVGNYLSEYNVPKSFRYDISDVIVNH